MPTVLYVEDNESIQRMYSYGLQKEGFVVTISSTAGEALARVAEAEFDFILLDLMLAGMSGLDFLKASDVKAKCPATKVIILTNLDSQPIKERLESFGVDGYLNKSMYEPKKLADYLKQMPS